MKYKIALVVGGLLLFVAGVFLYAHVSVPTDVTTKEGVESLFARRDARAAFEKFKELNAGTDEIAQHNAAHIFGEMLYEKSGIEGFSVCDAAFGFGCFHSFIGRAVADKGDSVVKTLDDECVKAYGEQGLGCSHGIGHGVLSFYGYNPEDLEKSLSLCRALTWKKPYGGCQDGAFMEYNFRTMETDERNRVRNFSAETRHEPCRALPEASRSACYFSQAEWWATALRDQPDVVARLAQYCKEVVGVEFRRACFRGVGYERGPHFSFKADSGVAYCDALSATDEEKVWCREGYAWALYADPQFRPDAEKVCVVGLSTPMQKQCKDEFLFVLN